MLYNGFEPIHVDYVLKKRYQTNDAKQGAATLLSCCKVQKV